MILSTPNRTAWSKLLTITLAEGFGRIPKGTHDFDAFIAPGADEGPARRRRADVRRFRRHRLVPDPRPAPSEDLRLNYLVASDDGLEIDLVVVRWRDDHFHPLAEQRPEAGARLHHRVPVLGLLVSAPVERAEIVRPPTDARRRRNRPGSAPARRASGDGRADNRHSRDGRWRSASRRAARRVSGDSRLTRRLRMRSFISGSTTSRKSFSSNHWPSGGFRRASTALPWIIGMRSTVSSKYSTIGWLPMRVMPASGSTITGVSPAGFRSMNSSRRSHGFSRTSSWPMPFSASTSRTLRENGHNGNWNSCHIARGFSVTSAGV